LPVCKCAPGWSGTNCGQTAAALCHPNPCQNGGTCKPKFGSNFCYCTSQWQGIHCNISSTKPPPPPPAKCDRHKFGVCVSKASSGMSPSAGICKLYTAFSACAGTYHCPDVLKIWCSLVHQKAPTCKIPQCQNLNHTSCNTQTYQRCFINVTSTKYSNDCDFEEAFVGCTVFSHCKDLKTQACSQKKVAKCKIAACATSSLLEDATPLMNYITEDHDEHDDDELPQNWEDTLKLAAEPFSDVRPTMDADSNTETSQGGRKEREVSLGLKVAGWGMGALLVLLIGVALYQLVEFWGEPAQPQRKPTISTKKVIV